MSNFDTDEYDRQCQYAKERFQEIQRRIAQANILLEELEDQLQYCYAKLSEQQFLILQKERRIEGTKEAIRSLMIKAAYLEEKFNE